ncbi:MAG: TIGR00725 family protein [Promethearchaeota archaeon]|nr:MAG: TIGR00725 family protein [Candidatus Lokiarchaeota archaeon]
MNFNFQNEYKAIISVIGASEIKAEIEQKALELGRLLAKNNYAISCGGLTGVMEAVCKGAKQEGGLTIGITPFEKKGKANQYVDIEIPVPFSQARNIIVVLSGDACVAVSGKAGTLSELCFAWIYNKPIIALTGIEGWSSKVANQRLDDRRKEKIIGFDNPQEIVAKLNEIFD